MEEIYLSSEIINNKTNPIIDKNISGSSTYKAGIIPII
jgi:hypothetical protein